MVYWTVAEQGGSQPRSQAFPSEDMMGALRLMEDLRSQQRAGQNISFVAMSSENPDAVGPAGVADPDPGYNWKKRRR